MDICKNDQKPNIMTSPTTKMLDKALVLTVSSGCATTHMDALITSGANVHTLRDGKPLTHSATCPRTFTYLVEHGVGWDESIFQEVYDERDCTLPDTICSHVLKSTPSSALLDKMLVFAIKNRVADHAIVDIVNAGANINMLYDGEPLTHLIAKTGRGDVLDMFLSLGVALNESIFDEHPYYSVVTDVLCKYVYGVANPISWDKRGDLNNLKVGDYVDIMWGGDGKWHSARVDDDDKIRVHIFDLIDSTDSTVFDPDTDELAVAGTRATNQRYDAKFEVGQMVSMVRVYDRRRVPATIVSIDTNKWNTKYGVEVCGGYQVYEADICAYGVDESTRQW
jgi:hypothetical protein